MYKSVKQCINISTETQVLKMNLSKKKLINWTERVFLLSSFFNFPSSSLSDHSDPLHFFLPSLTANHRQQL